MKRERERERDPRGTKVNFQMSQEFTKEEKYIKIICALPKTWWKHLLFVAHAQMSSLSFNPMLGNPLLHAHRIW